MCGRIGGDFMSGRFFTRPFRSQPVPVVARHMASTPDRTAGALAAVLALGLSAPKPTVFSGRDYFTPSTDILEEPGVVDERGFYFQHPDG